MTFLSLDPEADEPPTPSSASTAPTVVDEEDDERGLKTQAPGSQAKPLTAVVEEALSAATEEFRSVLLESCVTPALEAAAESMADVVKQLITRENDQQMSDGVELVQLRGQLQAALGTVESLTVRVREACDHTLQRSTKEEAALDASSRLYISHTEAVGRVELLESELRFHAETRKQVSALLSSVVTENMDLKKELCLLKLESVPRSLYEEEVVAHQNATGTLNQMRVQLEAAEAAQGSVLQQYDDLVSQQALRIHQMSEQLSHLQVAAAAATAAVPSSSEATLHPQVWTAALEELEAQARKGAEVDDLKAALAAAEEEVARLTTVARDGALDLREKDTEVQRLCDDCQTLTFRNAVLSQQVSSLLLRLSSIEQPLLTAGGVDGIPLPEVVTRAALQQELGVFQPLPKASARRLRNFGGCSTEGAAPCLPACDRLSGADSSSPAASRGLMLAGSPLTSFTVHDVKELVTRNQELVEQLYQAAQSSRHGAAAAADSCDSSESHDAVSAQRSPSASSTSESDEEADSTGRCSSGMEKNEEEEEEGKRASFSSSRMLHDLVESMCQRHELSRHSNHEVISQLLDCVSCMRSPASASVDSSILPQQAVTVTLLELCCSQAVQLEEERARVAALSQPTDDTISEAHEHVVEGLLRSIQSALSPAVTNSSSSAAAPSEAAPVQAAMSTESLAVFHNLLLVLQRGIEKDNAVQRLWNHVADQQALDAQSSAARASRKRPREQHVEASVVARSRSPVPKSSSTLSVRSSPAMTPLPSTTAAATLRERLSTLEIGYTREAEGEEDVGEADDGLLPRGLEALQERLALSHAAHREAAAALEAERDQHIPLLEQLWAMELERDAANQALQQLKDDCQSMITREAYDDLQVCSAVLQQDLAVWEEKGQQLTARVSELEELLSKATEAQKTAAEAHEAAAQQAIAALNEKDALLEEERQREEQAAASVSAMELQLQNSVQHNQTLMREVNRLSEEARRSQVSFLSHESVQQRLEEILSSKEQPDNTQEGAAADIRSAVAALHQRLVEQLRAEAERLRSQVAHAQIHISQLQATQRTLRGERETLQSQCEALQIEVLRASSSPTPPSPPAAAAAGESAAALHEEVDALKCELMVLREQGAAQQAREAALRKELEVMSRDPISEPARRYGVAHCVDVAAQLVTLGERVEALKHVEGELVTTRASQVKGEEERGRLQQQLEALEQHAAALQQKLVEKEAAFETTVEASNRLQAEYTKTHDERERLLSDNQQLISHMKGLQHHLKLGEDRERELKENVAKAEAELVKQQQQLQHQQLQQSMAGRSMSPLDSSLSASRMMNSGRLRTHRVSVTKGWGANEPSQ